jgi:hypothetical protein
MTRVLLKGALALVALFALPMGVVRLQSYAAAEVGTFLSPPEACLMPCWEGIRPGQTTVTEALRILQAHDWVEDVRTAGREINWAWSGAQPALIESDRRGSLLTFWDRVSSLMIPTRIRMGDLLLTGQQPRAVAYTRLTGTRLIAHLAVYDDFVLYSQIACPLNLSAIWTQPVILILDRRGLNIDDLPNHFANYDEPLWQRKLPRCQG